MCRYFIPAGCNVLCSSLLEAISLNIYQTVSLQWEGNQVSWQTVRYFVHTKCHKYICVTFLQRHLHTGHTLARWLHLPVLKVLLGSSSRSQSKFLRTRYVADLIFPYITLYFKFLSIGYVTEVKFPHVRKCWSFISCWIFWGLNIKVSHPYSCHDGTWGSSVAPTPLTSATDGVSTKDQMS